MHRIHARLGTCNTPVSTAHILSLIGSGCQHRKNTGQLVPWHPDLRLERVTVQLSQLLDRGIFYSRLGGCSRCSNTETVPGKLATRVSCFFQDAPEFGLSKRLLLDIDEQGAWCAASYPQVHRDRGHWTQLIPCSPD